MFLRYFFLAISFIFCASCAVFQSGRSAFSLISAPDAPPAEFLTSFPFQQFTGGVLIVKARVNDFPDTLNFIFDTGSGGISLDSATCQRLGLKVVPSDQFIRGIGGIKKLYFARDNSLILPNLRIDSLDFHINDYQFISSVYGVKIDGIIGYSFINRYIIQVNYDSMKVYVYSHGRYQYEPGGELLHPSIVRIPVIPAPLDNKKEVNTRYYFDMGAGLCLMLSNQFIEDSCIFCKPRQRRHKFIKTEAQGLMGEMTMTQTVVQKLQVGRYKFHKVPTYLFDDVSNVTAYPFLGGIVGNDLLRRFNVTLNYSQKEIYINPNSHFNEPFDYSYTGLVMYFIDGRVTITDIIKDSPAEKAGFKAGDIILSVNNNFSNNIQLYHELLKKTGTTAHLIIIRDGKPMEMKLKIKSIL